ncbi:FdrA family protein [Enterobacter hormaechei]|uniref:FdrA family protein n=1 Tax=Enterobacter hormaechei TaxID=158836 RepID=UPI001F3C7360|nr:FdrA family protein [Enterobacter hormaechei]MCF2195668.1 FdrA family protein [Enterobacter hormaechei]
MPTKIVIKKNTYFDSVSLMSVSTKANKLPGVEQAFVAMATEMNKGVLKNLGLLTPELADAKNGDLMIVIKGDAANDETLAAIEALFTRKERTGSHEARYASIASAKTHRPDSNLAVISVNGTFAAREARQALENDLNVMLFSDNVSLDDELALKQLAHEKGLLMMLDAIDMLEADDATRVIALISKPPAPAVAEKVLARARACRKPVVVCFLGRNEPPADEDGLQFARGTKEAALKAVLLTGIKKDDLDLHPLNWPLIEEVRTRLTSQQKYIRGLFCGGTLCDEAMFAALEKFDDVYSNIQPDPARHLKDISVSQAHTFLDFGDDDFTNGKPHPMIDPTNRISRLLQEARDPQVGVIVMDFVLGFGAHDDPVGVMIEAINEAQAIANADNRPLEILGYVLGTDQDPQSLAQQCQLLTDAGVIWASSSTNTGLLAREFVCKGEKA